MDYKALSRTGRSWTVTDGEWAENPRKSETLPVWAPDWTDDQVRAEFDRDHSMTVKRLAVATMKTPAEIKRILRA